MGYNEQVSEIPKVDFTGLHPSVDGGERWEIARAALAEALETFGCFDAIYPSLLTELREEMFESAVPELFSLPLDTKLKLVTAEPYHGYVGQIPHLAYESLPIQDAANPIAAQDFTRIMWPEGNSTFCDTVVAFAKPLQELLEILHKMILESLGAEKYYESFVRSISYGLRLANYGVPLNQETKLALDAHVDPNFLTIICQHKIGGLEIQTLDGTWVIVPPSSTSVTVLVGQAFQAWSNMRMRAPWHRVRILGKEKRFSSLIASRPSHNSIVKTPEELVDEDHPLLYKPFNYTELVRYLFSPRGLENKDAFNAYCRLSD